VATGRDCGGCGGIIRRPHSFTNCTSSVCS